jgi:hypothetical protein
MDMNVTRTDLKDFDAVEREFTARPVPFKVAGREWTADLSVNAGRMLRWMRSGSRVEALPTLLIALLGEDQYTELEDALAETNYDMAVLEEVVLWLAEQMGTGASGN